jgi:ribosomal protein L11 methyltransferase
MAADSWLEISLTVDGELAEAIAEVLARYVPNGVAIESTVIDPDGEGRPVGPVRVSGYLRMDADYEATRRKLEEGLWYLSRIQPLPEPQFSILQEADWAEAWKQHYHPLPIGRSLIIVPAWLASPEPQRVPIRMDPGMAFGTGTHPTTQLCLEFIEEQQTGDSPAETVIDVGCGSGILSVAALKLGAGRALAVDIDLAAVDASRENGQANGVADRLEVGRGSVVEILSGAFSLRQAPLVLANILAPVIIHLFGEGLGDLLSPGGKLVLSGILAEQAPAVLAAAKARGLSLVERRQVGEWVGLLVSKTP